MYIISYCPIFNSLILICNFTGVFRHFWTLSVRFWALRYFSFCQKWDRSHCRRSSYPTICCRGTKGIFDILSIKIVYRNEGERWDIDNIDILFVYEILVLESVDKNQQTLWIHLLATHFYLAGWIFHPIFYNVALPGYHLLFGSKLNILFNLMGMYYVYMWHSFNNAVCNSKIQRAPFANCTWILRNYF